MDDAVGGFIMGVVTGVFILCVCTKSPKEFKAEAVKQGFAEYNQSTGDWQWKEAKR